MSRLRVSWAMGVVAPWCLGIGLVVSMAADAGQDARIGASVAPAAILAATEPGNLIPVAVAGPGFGLDPEKPAGVQDARLLIGDQTEFTRMPDEVEPRAVLKPHAHNFPEIDRSHKGDPAIGLRPTFSSQLVNSRGLAAAEMRQTVFAADQTPPGTSGFGPAIATPAAGTLAPAAESPTTAPANAAVSPAQSGSAETALPAKSDSQAEQGATPQVGRAEALASNTPAPADATPVEVVALSSVDSVSAPRLSGLSTDRPNYASLIDEDQWRREQHCLAQAIYFEARGEGAKGQAAVAQVVLNRVSSGLYPSTICGVVFQNRQYYHACQFSFACEGRSLRITEPAAWRRAQKIAAAVTNGKTYVSAVGDATHYHALYVHPYWARRLERTDRIGHHVFYKPRDGET